MLTSLMSLTMTATRMPSRLLSALLRSVVLPAPRKPDRTVTEVYLTGAFQFLYS